MRDHKKNLEQYISGHKKYGTAMDDREYQLNKQILESIEGKSQPNTQSPSGFKVKQPF